MTYNRLRFDAMFVCYRFDVVFVCYRFGVVFVCCHDDVTFIYVMTIQTSKIYLINNNKSN